jgi:hypothetical protein
LLRKAAILASCKFYGDPKKVLKSLLPLCFVNNDQLPEFPSFPDNMQNDHDGYSIVFE